MDEQQVEVLFHAIESGDVAAVTSVLETEPDLAQHWRMEAPCTPLHAAVGKPQILALLIGKGAEPNMIDSDEEMTTPLHLATAGGHLESAKFLVDAKADLNAHSSYGTPLHCALGSIDGTPPDNVKAMLELLIEAGADMNASMNPDTDVWTPLHQAASEGIVEGVNVLLEHGAKVFLQKDGLSALRVAESMGYDEIVSILRQHGAS